VKALQGGQDAVARKEWMYWLADKMDRKDGLKKMGWAERQSG
jgi:hypothetical protein